MKAADVAFILERERDSTIKEWLKRVNLVADLTYILAEEALHSLLSQGAPAEQIDHLRSVLKDISGGGSP